MEKILNYIMHPSKIILYLMNKGFFRWLPNKQFIKIKYRLATNKKLDLKNVQTFNEKLQWLKLYVRDSKYAKMVDKYEAKKYVASIIGEEYIIPTIGVYNKFEEINFNELPNQFVLKPTHTSGDIFICKDKSKIDYKKLKKQVNKWLKRDYYYNHREWSYKNIIPRIIIEKYMEDESKSELKDYKVFNFSGKAKLIEVDFGRFTKHERNFYDTDWNFISDLSILYPNNQNVQIEKPKQLQLMLSLAEKLSAGIAHLRTDFYSIEDKIYFGELTFYHGAGYEEINPESWNKKLGDWLELPKEKREKNAK